MVKIPRFPTSLAVITLIYGMFTFMWLSAEDSVWLVSVLGAMMSVLSVLHGVFRLKRRTYPARLWVPGLILLGALSGAGSVVGTVILMVMKTSLHSHVFPDYPFPLIAGIVERVPVWTLAGALIGLALALLVYESSRGAPS
jgi:hypothetical protein